MRCLQVWNFQMYDRKTMSSVLLFAYCRYSLAIILLFEIKVLCSGDNTPACGYTLGIDIFVWYFFGDFTCTTSLAKVRTVKEVRWGACSESRNSFSASFHVQYLFLSLVGILVVLLKYRVVSEEEMISFHVKSAYRLNIFELVVLLYTGAVVISFVAILFTYC